MTEPLHYSTLKLIGTSAHAYRHRAPTEALHLRKGSATHALTFGDKNVAVYDGVRRGKEWDAFQVENRGSVLVNVKEHADAKIIADAVRNDPLVQELGLLSRANVIEKEILWKFHGREFSSTPDSHCPAFGMDLKTTRDAKPQWFTRDIMRYHYHVQAALYREAIEQVYGYRPQAMYCVAVESKPPYHVVVFKFTEALLELGARTAILWMEQLRQCESADHWPGYSQTIVDVDVPEWMVDDHDEEEESEEA